MTLTEIATPRPRIQSPFKLIPVTLAWGGGEDIADMEATDAVIVSDTLEQIDIGGGGLLPAAYLRISGPDLVRALEALRDLAAEAIRVVIDARQEHEDAKRIQCPWCPTRIEPDEPNCGAADCTRNSTLDAKGLIP